MAGPRMTIPTQRVLRALLSSDSDGTYGRHIARTAGLASGTVHPILARLEGVGWVESRWEDVDPREAGRPARRFYCLTSQGREGARDALARVRRPAAVSLGGRTVQGEW
jgi:PadR family transcriptional regulator PadR